MTVATSEDNSDTPVATPEPEFPAQVNRMMVAAKATPTVRQKVARFLADSGFKPVDPFYRILAALGLLTYLVEEAPDETGRRMKATYEVIQNERAAQIAETQALLMQQMVATLPEAVRQVGAGSLGRLLGLGSLPIAALCLTLSGGVGAGIGHLLTRYYNPVHPDGEVTLTVAEMEALQWAKSPQGQMARNLQAWNPTLTTGECEAETKNLGIKIFRKDGKSLVGGHCVIYTQPPSARRYR